ncbi:MAG TPA: DedA family protein [Candidatus Dormibacteraeota bacterium]|nr:DedA family protein [Candidatus Dormibacteraeota bacterium]
MSFLNGLNGSVAILLLCALLYLDEVGVPLPFAPNEVLLVFAGLLIGTNAIAPWLFVPLAYVALVAGCLTGFGWARRLGSERLRGVAVRLRAEKAYDRARARVQRAGSRSIGITRLLPGVRTYATLVAGASEMPLRTFATGAIPALAIWEVIWVGIGVAVGAPAEHLLGRVERVTTGGILLIAAGVGSYLAIRKVPSADEDLERMISQVPSAPRLVLAAILDFGVVATIVSGADRIIRAAAHIRHFGLRDFLVLIGAVIVAYVVITRRGPGATAGERLLKVSYRVRIPRPPRRRRRDHTSTRSPRTGQAPAEDPREAASH